MTDYVLLFNGIAIAVGTIVEDIITWGAGVLDDPATFAVAGSLILLATATSGSSENDTINVVIAGTTPATPQPPNDFKNNSSKSSKDAKKIDGNSEANRFAQKNGFKNAEALKKEFLKDAIGVKDKIPSHYDIYVNNTTGDAFIISKDGLTVIELFL